MKRWWAGEGRSSGAERKQSHGSVAGITLPQLLARHGPRFLAGTGGPMAISLASAGVYGRLMAPSDWGMYAIAASLGALIASLSGTWVDQGSLRYVPAQDAKGRSETASDAIMLLGSIALIVAGFGAAMATVARAVGWPAPTLWALTGALAAGRIIFSGGSTLLRAGLRSGAFASLDIVRSAVGTAAGIALVAAAWGAAGRLAGEAAAFLACGVVGLFVARGGRSGVALGSLGKRSVRARLRSAADTAAKFGHYGAPMTAWFAASSIMSVGDRWLLGLMVGSDEVGIYSANYQLASAGAAAFATPTMMTLHPALMKAWDNGDHEAASESLRTITKFTLVLAPALIGLAGVVGTPLAVLILGESYRSSLVVPLVVGGVAFWQLGLYVQKPFEFNSRTRSLGVIAIGAAGFNLAANTALIPIWGAEGAAAATLLSYVGYAFVVAKSGERFFEWGVPWRWMFASIGVSGVVIWMLTASPLI